MDFTGKIIQRALDEPINDKILLGLKERAQESAPDTSTDEKSTNGNPVVRIIDYANEGLKKYSPIMSGLSFGLSIYATMRSAPAPQQPEPVALAQASLEAVKTAIAAQQVLKEITSAAATKMVAQEAAKTVIKKLTTKNALEISKTLTKILQKTAVQKAATQGAAVVTNLLVEKVAENSGTATQLATQTGAGSMVLDAAGAVGTAVLGAAGVTTTSAAAPVIVGVVIIGSGVYVSYKSVRWLFGYDWHS